MSGLVRQDTPVCVSRWRAPFSWLRRQQLRYAPEDPFPSAYSRLPEIVGRSPTCGRATVDQ